MQAYPNKPLKMKKIKFEHLSLLDNKFQFAMLMIAMLFLILYTFKPFELISQKTYQILFSLVFIILIFVNGKVVWTKNIVQWNKKGIVIKINDFWGKNYKFNEISNFHILNKELTITKFDGNKNVFDLKNIEPESVKKIMEILKCNT